MTPVRSFREIVGVPIPLVQAPIGSCSTPALAAAVSNAGALGMLSVTWRSIAETRAVIRATRALTDRPFGVNLVLAWDQEERLRVCLEAGVRVVSLFWGDPSPHVATVHDAGAVLIHGVGSVAEARAAVDAGVEIIVAQGWEAGGHVRGEVATMALVPAVVDAVSPVPVLAAGGIADGRGLAAALALGAQGAWLGTRFVASREARAHAVYQRAIVAASDADTVHTSLFDGGWPNAPHRVIRNTTVAAWERAGRPAPGGRPGEGEEVARWTDGGPIARYADLMPLPEMTGDLEALALYAGQSAGSVHEILPAGDIVRTIWDEARAALDRSRDAAR